MVSGRSVVAVSVELLQAAKALLAEECGGVASTTSGVGSGQQ